VSTIDDKSHYPNKVYEVYSLLKDIASPFIPPNVDQHLTYDICGPGILMRRFHVTDEEAKALERALNLAFTQGYITRGEEEKKVIDGNP
jgi:hypothetical protein